MLFVDDYLGKLLECGWCCISFCLLCALFVVCLLRSTLVVSSLAIALAQAYLDAFVPFSLSHSDGEVYSGSLRLRLS